MIKWQFNDNGTVYEGECVSVDFTRDVNYFSSCTEVTLNDVGPYTVTKDPKLAAYDDARQALRDSSGMGYSLEHHVDAILAAYDALKTDA